MARKTSRNSGRTVSQAKKGPTTRRRVAVLVSLAGVLTFTSALLLALAPAPLTPQAPTSLFAMTDGDAPQSFDTLFESVPTAPVGGSRWHYIYIHHSRSLSGSAQTMGDSEAGLADHFVIGNGDGCADGEIQIGRKWIQQQPPGRTAGADWIKLDCISICLVGDFNQSRPTKTQQHRLEQLVSVLQSRLHIPGKAVYFDSRTATEAGIGAYFPAAQFREQILP